MAKKGVSLTETDVTDFVAVRVASAKRITGGVVFLAEIPKLLVSGFDFKFNLSYT